MKTTPITITVLFIFLLFPYISVSSAARQDITKAETVFQNNQPNLEEIKVLIEEHFPGKFSKEQIADGAMNGMLNSLDPYSEYLNPKEYSEITDELHGEYAGIGLIIAIRADYPVVKKVLNKSPREVTGLLEGDQIIEINGEKTYRESLVHVMRNLRGPIGSFVSLDFMRKGSNTIHSIQVERKKINIESVRDARMLNESLGYIKLNEFIDSTKNEFDESYNLLKEKQADTILIDLRNNTGGSLEACIKLSEKFLEKGSKIVEINEGKRSDKTEYYSTNIVPDMETSLFILVNRMTASAAEIFASALKDNARASIIGEKTYGKGSVQSILPLKSGGAVRLTTAYYITPSGKTIEGKGIEPDLELTFPDDIHQMIEIENNKDSVLIKTMELISAEKEETEKKEGEEKKV